jgi:predicted TIM-barrel fold metal-dependent hydrolase
MPVIDAHIHLFDPTRAGGVPWPTPKDTALYKPALPNRYAHLAEPHGVVGAIAIEASPWLIDNFWLNDLCTKNSILLGFIGDLLPESPDFAATLDHLHRSPFFLGIRCGNLWNRDLLVASSNPAFTNGLKLLAQSGLVLETANPDANLIAAVVRISDQVPNLRIVLDHLPNASIPTDAAKRADYDANLRELAHRPQIFVKGSEIVRRIGTRVPLDLAAYKDSLDQLWDLFGEDRIFFGSDWPNSDSVATYDQVFHVAKSYIATRSLKAQQKYLWKNSIAVYHWKARTPAQQQLQSEA